MRYALAVLLALPPVVVAACGGDVAEDAFLAAAAADRQQQPEKAVDLYIQAHKAAPDSRYGKLAGARAEVVLLEIGAEQLDAEQWDALEKTAGRLLELESKSGAGLVYKGCALHGKGQAEEAERLLKSVSGEVRGIAPPSYLAVEATAAVYGKATGSARAHLAESAVDSPYLALKRDSVLTAIDQDRRAAKQRQDLFAAGTLDSMAALLNDFGDSAEASKVRRPYAEQVAAKLESPEKLGPPTEDDPDPIATLADSLKLLAPEEPAAVAVLAKIDRLRPAWEQRYAEEIKQMAAGQAKARDQIAAIIRDKCAPLMTKVQAGDLSAAEPLQVAAEEAAALIPPDMPEEEVQEAQASIIKGCTPGQ